MAVVSLLALAAAVGALADAGWRAAAALGADGALRVVAAAPLAATTAALTLLALGRAGLSGSQPLVVLAAAAVWVAARVGLPAPWSPRGQQGRWPAPERLALGATLGAGLAWTAWVLRHPGLGIDPLTYHLPQSVLWVQHGDAGAVRQVVYEFPIGNYPLADETLVSWVLAAGRSFAPALLWVPAMTGLGALAGMTGLRRAGVGVLPAALGVASILVIPISTSQWIGPHTDPGALAWLACVATLAVAARERRGLLAPALLAAGLAIGTKTTTAPLLLALAVLVVRPPLPRRGPLLAAATAAAVVGGLWYVRDLMQHGSPLWPFVAMPWGDPAPPVLRAIGVTFLDRLGPSLDGRGGDYLRVLGAAPLLLLAAPLAALVVRRRAVVLAAGVSLLAALIWSRAPFTGRAPDATVDLSLTTVRYLVPALAVAMVALCLARGRVWTAVLGVCAGVSAFKALELGYPLVPSAGVPALGAAAGLAATRMPARAVALGGGVVLAAALLVTGQHFAARHARNPRLARSPMIAWIATQPGFAGSDAPVASSSQVFGVLAGDRLQHSIGLIAADATCAQVRANHGWVVVETPPPSRFRVHATAPGCLSGERPAYADPLFRVYDRRQTATTSSTASRPSSTSRKSSSSIAAARGSAVRRARLSSAS